MDIDPNGIQRRPTPTEEAERELSGGEHLLTLDLESYRVDRAPLEFRAAETAPGMACR